MFSSMAPSSPSLPRLAPARVHEAGGPAAPAFALTMAAQTTGAVIWIRPAHAPERLMPWALRRFLSPGRLLMVEARGEADLLWAAEEALRSGAAGFVVAAPEKPLSLTAGRRLQLAAEAGRTTGLLLIREDGGSNAAETRWHCTPLPGEAPDSTRALWSRNKNKKGTLGAYTVHWHGTAHSLPLVAPAGERDVAAPSSA